MSKRLLGELELNRIYQRECIEGMRMIPDKSIDMILCDLPYGTTKNKWDTIIPLDCLWDQYKRIIKDNGAIVLTSAEPFTSVLVTSNLKMFRYDLIWEKQKGSDPLNAKRKPLRAHENMLVFYKRLPTYNPQFTEGKPYEVKGDYSVKSSNFNSAKQVKGFKSDGKRYPKTVMKFTNEGMFAKNLHPTQKPVDLFAYLIRTYTNEGEIVLDNCMGSGTTAIAALRTNRQFIGFELEREYVEIANKRIDNELEAK